MLDIRQTPEYAIYLRKIGWIVEEKNGVYYFIKKLPLIGSIIKIQRPQKIDYQYTDVLVVKHRVFRIILEPLEPKGRNHESRIMNYGFRKSKNSYLPTKTLQLDLTKTEEELLKTLKKDARRALRKTKDLRFTIYDLRNIKEFRKAWKSSVGWRHYVPPLSHLIALKKSFGDNCNLSLCSNTLKHDRSIISGAVFLKTKEIAYYWQAFTNKKGRKLQAQYKIVWEGIRWTKNQGCKIFDFEGIYDERFPNRSWLGFSHFKKSFGGCEVKYPGCYTKIRWPI